MEDKKEITAVDYDGLLELFVSKERHRPGMCQPNSIDNITYATDGVWMVMIPNKYLRNIYPAHEKTPNYKTVLDQVKECDTKIYKDTDLFKAMQVHPKVYDESECEECEGEGNCPRCGHRCDHCNGDGTVEDRSLPMVYSSKATIQLGMHRFGVHRLAILEKTVAKLMEDTFELVGFSGAASLFNIGPIQILLARYNHEEHEIP